MTLPCRLELLGDLGDLGSELAVELVAADARQVVAAVLEERVAEVGAGRLDGGRLARAGPLVDLDQCFVLGRGDVALLVPLTFEEVELGDEPLEEAGGVGLVEAERAQQREDAEATLAGDAGAAGDVLAGTLLDVELHPLTAVRVDRALDELVLGQVAEAVALARLEDDAGAAHELRHDDALGAVDDERALLGHRRKVAHEHGLLFDLTGVAVHEPGAHEDRRAVGHVLLLALLHRELGRRAQVLVEGVELELELERLGEVLDRADVAERLREPFFEEPLEALALDRDQVGEFERFVQVGERITLTGGRAGSHGSPHGVGSGRSAHGARRTNTDERSWGKARHGNRRSYPDRYRIVNRRGTCVCRGGPGLPAVRHRIAHTVRNSAPCVKHLRSGSTRCAPSSRLAARTCAMTRHALERERAPGRPPGARWSCALSARELT